MSRNRRGMFAAGIALYGGTAAAAYAFVRSHQDSPVSSASSSCKNAFDALAEEYDAKINFDERLLGIPLMRWWLVRQAKGDVLEVSAGTGRNLRYYDPGRLHTLTLADSSARMLRVGASKFESEGFQEQWEKKQQQQQQQQQQQGGTDSGGGSGGGRGIDGGDVRVQRRVSFVVQDAQRLCGDGASLHHNPRSLARFALDRERSSAAAVAAVASEQAAAELGDQQLLQQQQQQQQRGWWQAAISEPPPRQPSRDSSKHAGTCGGSTGGQRQGGGADANGGGGGDGYAGGADAGVSTCLAPSSYDTVVDTFGLCSHQDPVAALKEMARACKPGGRLLLLQHGKARPWYAWLNSQLDQSAEQHHHKWGCWWNRDIQDIVDKAGIRVLSSSRWHFGTTYIIVAQPAAEVAEAAAEAEVPS